MLAVTIHPTEFATAFRRFEEAVEAYEHSPGPFTDFQHGLADFWERYKVGVYHKAKELLGVKQWRSRSFGEGHILRAVISAIEIKEWAGERNNLVEWEAKGRPPESVTHFRMLEALKSPSGRKAADAALFRMYAEEAEPASCFAELTSLFGSRYDLIAYLFFLRDREEYMPTRSTIFPQAFDILGVPLTMRSQCKWENYQEYLARLREVHRQLKSLDIPGTVSLLDAHSFCWMLVKLPPARRRSERQAEILHLKPEAGETPTRPKGGYHFTQAELDESQQEQRRLGAEAVSVVLNSERSRLRKLGNAKLADRVKDVSNDTSLGYDIESFTFKGEAKRIEVKAAARRGDDLRFFLSENERRCSQALEGYCFAVVFGVRTSKPSIFEFFGRELPKASLHPVNYEVRLRYPPSDART